MALGQISYTYFECKNCKHCGSHLGCYLPVFNKHSCKSCGSFDIGRVMVACTIAKNGIGLVDADTGLTFPGMKEFMRTYETFNNKIEL